MTFWLSITTPGCPGWKSNYILVVTCIIHDYTRVVVFLWLNSPGIFCPIKVSFRSIIPSLKFKKFWKTIVLYNLSAKLNPHLHKVIVFYDASFSAKLLMNLIMGCCPRSCWRYMLFFKNEKIVVLKHISPPSFS